MNLEKVLVAVPDLILRAKVADAVRFAARVPVTAKSAVAVLEQARSERPALVIVDLGDDRVAPFETIRSLKDDPRTASARVVGFYAHVETSLRDRARDAGCDEIVPRSAFVKRLAQIVATPESSG